MGSRNATVLAQTRYFARHLHRAVKELIAHPVYQKVAERGIPNLFAGTLVPAVVKINGYLTIQHGMASPIRDARALELFLEPDPSESQFFATQLGHEYGSIRETAFRVATHFDEFEPSDFRRLWEITLASVRASQPAALNQLATDLEHLFLNADTSAEFFDLP